jgi:hypothetical protein
MTLVSSQALDLDISRVNPGPPALIQALAMLTSPTMWLLTALGAAAAEKPAPLDAAVLGF